LSNRFYILSAIVLAVLQGCGLDNPSRDRFVETEFSVAVPAGFETSMLRVFVYDHEDGTLKGQFFVSDRTEDGFTCKQELRKGTYDLVAYNFDIADTYIRGEASFSTLEAYTSQVDERLCSNFVRFSEENTPIVYTPETVIVSVIRDVAVKEGAAIHGEALPLTSVSKVSLPAEGVAYASTSTGIVSGFATSYFLAAGKTGESARLYFEMQPMRVDATNGYLTASINTFGRTGQTHNFMFNVLTSSQSKVFTAVTGVNFDFPGSIEIPKPDNSGNTQSGSGFTPEVGNWRDLTLDIPIGI